MGDSPEVVVKCGALIPAMLSSMIAELYWWYNSFQTLLVKGSNSICAWYVDDLAGEVFVCGASICTRRCNVVVYVVGGS